MGTKDSVKTSRPMHKKMTKQVEQLKQTKGSRLIKKGWRDKFAKAQNQEEGK